MLLDKNQKPKEIKRLVIEEYYEVFHLHGLDFVLHKPTTPVEGWKEYMVTEIRTGASAVSAETLKEVKNKWVIWSTKITKKDILLKTARTMKKTKKMLKEWEQSR
jgi:hypothetical protein